MVELRTQSQRIVRDLKRGEHLLRGKPLAELIPSNSAVKMAPAEAINRAQTLAKQDPEYKQRAHAYLQALREDQKAWSERGSA